MRHIASADLFSTIQTQQPGLCTPYTFSVILTLGRLRRDTWEAGGQILREMDVKGMQLEHIFHSHVI